MTVENRSNDGLEIERFLQGVCAICAIRPCRVSYSLKERAG